MSLASLVLPAVRLIELDNRINYVRDEELKESGQVGEPILRRYAGCEVVAEEILPFDGLVYHNQSSVKS